MENIIRVIEDDINNIKTKILWMSFSLPSDLKLLFTPRLENLSFIKIDNTITVNLRNPTYRDYFNDWIDKFILKINFSDTSEERIEKFNKEIKALISLGQKENKLSWQAAMGLYGEFLVIKTLLEENNYTHIEVIEGWHRPAPANHDFDYQEYSLEVKTVSRDSTTVKITSQYQLEALDGKPLRLMCYRIEKIDNSNADSLGDLYTKIKNFLPKGIVNLFEIKCAEDVFCEYLGPGLMPLEYKFSLIEDNLYEVDQITFPRVKKHELNPAVSKFSYSLDISSLESFKIK
jgi:hypothetical protein